MGPCISTPCTTVSMLVTNRCQFSWGSIKWWVCVIASILCSNHCCRGRPSLEMAPSSSKSLSSLPKRALSVSGGGVVSGTREKGVDSSAVDRGQPPHMTLSSPPSPKKVAHASTLPFRTLLFVNMICSWRHRDWSKCISHSRRMSYYNYKGEGREFITIPFIHYSGGFHGNGEWENWVSDESQFSYSVLFRSKRMSRNQRAISISYYRWLDYLTPCTKHFWTNTLSMVLSFPIVMIRQLGGFAEQHV